MKITNNSRKFYLICSELVLAYAHAIAKGNPALSKKDLAQDVLVNILKIKLFERVRDAGESFNLEGYLYQSVRYRFYELVKQKQNITIPLENIVFQLAEEKQEQKREENIEELINQFMFENASHREKIEAFLKKYKEGKSGEAIALEYNINPNLVYQWISRAKLHLATYLTAKGVTPDKYFE